MCLRLQEIQEGILECQVLVVEYLKNIPLGDEEVEVDVSAAPGATGRDTGVSGFWLMSN